MKTIIKSDYRVEVYPKTRVYGISVADEEEVCKDIIKDIVKHVDNVYHTNIIYTSDNVCSFCGSEWTEDSASYNGGCCKKDQEEEDIRHPPAVLESALSDSE